MQDVLGCLAPKGHSKWITIDSIRQKYVLGSPVLNFRSGLLLQHNTETTGIYNRSAFYSNKSAFSYNPNIIYTNQSSVTIGEMSKTCPKCLQKME